MEEFGYLAEMIGTRRVAVDNILTKIPRWSEFRNVLLFNQQG